MQYTQSWWSIELRRRRRRAKEEVSRAKDVLARQNAEAMGVEGLTCPLVAPGQEVLVTQLTSPATICAGRNGITSRKGLAPDAAAIQIAHGGTWVIRKRRLEPPPPGRKEMYHRLQHLTENRLLCATACWTTPMIGPSAVTW